jgi:hypothetical protein
MATFEIQMPDGGVYQVEAPEGTTDAQAYQYALSQIPPPKPEVGIGEAFGTGFERGVGRLGSTVTDIIPALVGSAVGAEDYAQRQFQEAAEKEAALPAPIFPSYKDVEGVGDFTKFVAETIGEQIPNLGVALATALTGGAAAPVLGATRAAGQFAGAAFGSYALNAPEIFQNIYEETGETAPGTALLFGSAAAALDSILPAALAKNMSAPVKAEVTKKILERSGMKPSVLRSGTVGLAKGLGTEGLTEGAQEAISIAAERLIDENPDIFGSKEFDRIMESAVRGAVAGGGFGTVGGGIEGAREKGARRQRLNELTEARKLRDEASKRVELMQGQLELPGIEPVSPQVLEAQINAETARVEGAGAGAPVVSRIAALELARRQGLDVPAEGSFDSLNAEQKKVVEDVQKLESERVLYEDAAIEAERQGVVFDTTKPMGELSTQELDILETVRQQRIGRFGRKQQQLFTKEGEAAPAIERQAKKAEKEQAAIDKAAKQAAEKERKAAEKLAKEQRTRLQKAEQLELDLQPAVAPTDVSEEAVTARQGDIFAGLPGEQTRAPSVGKDLNDFLKGQGLPVNAATKKAFAGRDLAVPEQRAQVVTDLRTVAERSKSAANIDAIDNVIQQLEPTAAATAVEDAPVAGPAVEAASAQEITTKPAEAKEKPTSTVKKLTGEDGKPLVLYRGIASEESIPEAALRGEPRQGYAVFASTSPYVAASYSGTLESKETQIEGMLGEEGIVTGATVPLHVYADKVIEFPVRVGRDGSRSFSFSDFDDAATKLPANTVLVARQVYDSGPRVSKSIDPEGLYSFPSDIYAWSKGTKTTSATEAKATTKPKTKAKEKSTEDDIPQQGVQFFPNGKITDIGIKQLAIAHTKNMRKPKALRDSGITEAFNWFMNEDNASVTEANLAAYQKAVDAFTMNAPVYRGAAFSPEISQLATRGRLAPLLNKLIPSQSPEIQRILRKIGTQNLRTRIVVGATPEGTSGFYDAATDVITLNPTSGMNEHTALHETGHASLAQALNDPNLQITKDFFKFFSDIKTQMGDAYGGQNLQEFVAELVGNPEFQALLKQIKAPQSKTMWQTIMDSIAKFFGFRKEQSAYDKGLDFIDKLLDVSQGVEPTLTDQLFLGTPKMAMDATAKILTGTPEFVGKKADNVGNAISRLYSEGGGGLASRALSAFRLQDMVRMTAEKFPELSKKLKALQTALISRQGALEKKIKEIQDNYRVFEKIQKKFPRAVETLGTIALKARKGEYDLVGVDPEFDITKLSPERKAEFTTLANQFRALPSEVQAMYKDMRQGYRDVFLAYKKFVLDKAKDGSQRAELEAQFTKNAPAIGYMPALRFGEYFLEYTDVSSGVEERVVTAFESPAQRSRFIAENRNIIKGDPLPFDKAETATFSPERFPPTSFVSKVMDVVPQGQKDDVYQVLLSLYPESTYMDRMKRYKGTEGASIDVVRGYGDTMLKGVRKVNTLEYLPQVQNAIDEIIKERGTGLSQAIRDEIIRRNNTGFMQNPSYGKMTSFFATGAYSLFLLGNASSALINTSAILLLTYPRLASRYGFSEANKVLMSAMQEALPSFRPKNQRQESLIEYKWQSDPKYKALYDGLMEKAQLEHTLSREILEGSKQSTADFNSNSARFMNLLSMPFSGAEKYSRATTAIATYNLAKASGKTDAQAVEEAVNEVMDVHTSGLAAEGPSLMQHPLGRVMFTFKSFIWNSANVIGMTMYDSVASENAATRSSARKQVLGIYAVSAALGGINGLPFFGAAATFANILEALNPFDDDDEPFNAKEEVRAATNDLLFKGPLNYLTNLEISNRVGLANGMLFREDPYSVEERGYLMTALMQATGPVGSYAFNLENAMGLLGEGEYGRFAEAMSPSALRNIFKGARYIKEGARTRSGEEIDTDINGYNLFMQVLGFSPADISNAYENRSMALNYQAKVRARRQKILKKYYVGKENGDVELMLEAREELQELRMQYPGIASNDTLARSYRSKKAYEKDLILGLRFDKGLKDRANRALFRRLYSLSSPYPDALHSAFNYYFSNHFNL